MVIRNLNYSHEHKKQQVKALIEKRIKEIHRREDATDDGDLKACYESQEAILDEVVQLAHGQEDDESLIRIIDYCIVESHQNKIISTGKGLKSYYSMRLRVLKGLARFAHALAHPKRWIKNRKKRGK